MISAHPLLETRLANGVVVSFRQSRGAGTGCVVLLHGIGSNSASWAAQLAQGLNAGRVLAWDAPGYGASSALAALRPSAQDYAQVLWAWLDELGIAQVHLAGHSLGCIMAARAAALQPERVQSLTLLSPALGYARASEADREAKRAQRLDALATLGPQGMADKRSGAMLSDAATPAQQGAVRRLMGSIDPFGYTQAVHLLMDADVQADVARISQVKTRVACGAADAITPPEQSAAFAAQFGLAYEQIAGAGHALAIEAPVAVNEYLSL